MKTMNGFTFIEVMAALAIVAIIMAALGGLQFGIIRGTRSSSAQLGRSWAMTTFINEARTADVKVGQKKQKEIKELDARMTYQSRHVNKQSQLGQFKDIVVETIEVEWKGPDGTDLSDTLTMINYRYPEEKDEEGDEPS